jgi:hypothetical protein
VAFGGSAEVLEQQRYDGSEHEPFQGAAALGLPLSLHTATRRQGRIRGAGVKTLRDASSRATKAFYPALSICNLIFSGPICSPQWTTRTASATARRFTGLEAALAKAGDGMLPSAFLRRNIVLSFQEDAIGIRPPPSFPPPLADRLRGRVRVGASTT